MRGHRRLKELILLDDAPGASPWLYEGWDHIVLTGDYDGNSAATPAPTCGPSTSIRRSFARSPDPDRGLTVILGTNLPMTPILTGSERRCGSTVSSRRGSDRTGPTASPPPWRQILTAGATAGPSGLLSERSARCGPHPRAGGAETCRGGIVVRRVRRSHDPPPSLSNVSLSHTIRAHSHLF